MKNNYYKCSYCEEYNKKGCECECFYTNRNICCEQGKTSKDALRMGGRKLKQKRVERVK